MVDCPPLDAKSAGRAVAVNDAVVTSGQLGRMVGSMAIGRTGPVRATGSSARPLGSTAYNLSNGGPVLMWGLDAMATTFVAPPRSARPPVRVARGQEVVAWNRTIGVCVRGAGRRTPHGRRRTRRAVAIRLGEQRSLLGTLPEATFAADTAELRRLKRAPPLRTGVPSSAGSTICSSRASTPPNRESRPHREAELKLAPAECATGETGAGKTIFAQAIGLLLGTKGDAAAVGPAGAEAYVEAELDVPDGFFDEDELAALAELRPEDESGLVLARRVFADGRTRAYAGAVGCATTSPPRPSG